MVIHHGTGDPFLPVGLAQHALRIAGVHAYAVPAVTRTLWVTPPLSLGQPLLELRIDLDDTVDYECGRRKLCPPAPHGLKVNPRLWNRSLSNPSVQLSL